LREAQARRKHPAVGGHETGRPGVRRRHRARRAAGGRSDEDVWAAAQAEGRFLVTHDLDFSDTRKFEPGQHAGVLIVRPPDSEQWRVGDHLVGWFSDPDAHTWERCMVVATVRKVRVVRGATTKR